MNSTKFNYILIVTVLILGVLLYYKGCNQPSGQDELKQLQTMYDASESQVRHYETKAGQDSAVKQVQIGKIAELKALHSKDSTEILLQKLVNKNTISASVVSTETKGTIQGKTTVIKSPNENREIVEVNEKTKEKDSTKCVCDTACYPTYGLSYKNKWEIVDAVATNKKFTIEYKILEQYEIAQEFKQEGKWYNRKEVPYVSVKSLNPRTMTTNVQSFAVQPPKQDKIILGLGTTYGWDVSTFKPGLSVGLTLSFKLWAF